MFIIESKYGNDGYAVWFKLLESLAKTDDHWMDLSDPSNMMYLCAKCRVSNDIMEAIISDLANLGEVDAQLWKDERVIWSQKFTDSIEEAYKKRSNVCPNREAVINKLRGLGRCKPPKGQSQGDVNPYTKVNNNKPKETKEKSVPPPPTIDEVIAYFKENGYTEASARKAYDYYQASVTETKRHWSDGKGQPVRNWKMKMQSVWFKDENKYIEQSGSLMRRSVTLPDGSIRTYADITL
jgi:hypothetical protein